MYLNGLDWIKCWLSCWVGLLQFVFLLMCYFPTGRLPYPAELFVPLVLQVCKPSTTRSVGSTSPHSPARRKKSVLCKGKVQPCSYGRTEIILAGEQDTKSRCHCWPLGAVHPCGPFLGVLSRYMGVVAIAHPMMRSEAFNRAADGCLAHSVRHCACPHVHT